ncbi:MerR family transcriptional regulator [Streptomyces sp. NPDC051776]|uniref:helix-turn-helix domain-containing protein n=1 Tax=Streptomyces sp. NPDC051776 TaxID=3155414 RepID=UPI0034201EAD
MNTPRNRTVKIGEAAKLTGTTPRAIRHYHQVDLLPEPERGHDGRRRYGYDAIVRILWIRRMTELGMRLDHIRTSLAARNDQDRKTLLDELDETLATQEETIRRQRRALRRLRETGSDLGLLAPNVTELLTELGAVALSQADLDTLLVTEHLFGPEAAAHQAQGHHILATHSELRAERDRIDRKMAELKDAEADDPRVEELAAQFFAHIQAMAEIERAAGFPQSDEPGLRVEVDTESGQVSLPDLEPFGNLPTDESPAQRRCAELIGLKLAGWSPAERGEA